MALQIEGEKAFYAHDNYYQSTWSNGYAYYYFNQSNGYYGYTGVWCSIFVSIYKCFDIMVNNNVLYL